MKTNPTPQAAHPLAAPIGASELSATARSQVSRPRLLAILSCGALGVVTVVMAFVHFATWLTDIDSCEYTEGDFCRHCRDVVSAPHDCPRELVGFCIDCGIRRVLDYYGNCETCGSGSVTERRCNPFRGGEVVPFDRGVA